MYVYVCECECGCVYISIYISIYINMFFVRLEASLKIVALFFLIVLALTEMSTEANSNKATKRTPNKTSFNLFPT